MLLADTEPVEVLQSRVVNRLTRLDYEKRPSSLLESLICMRTSYLHNDV
ncbi:hypothetical protein Q3H58_004045 [Pseudomonas psychrotolerans]|nr:hypothetical protein [Pseudomonas psychrotolerans]